MRILQPGHFYSYYSYRMSTRAPIPMQPTAIIGREYEISHISNLLVNGVRLLTLTGPGGIGKTRLAIHAASLLASHFADGTFFVPLAHITAPSATLPAIAHAIDIKPENTGSPAQALVAFLKTRHILLVLDNFEQIAAAAPDIALLIAECPHLAILVTSRSVLHLRGEHEFAVPPLALPDYSAESEAATLSQFAAVSLFLQRAMAVRPDFKLSSANAPVVAEICARLDGLPLAIELAAARVKILTPQAMLPRLNNRLQFLQGGAVDLPERQQTLRNTIAWSYELLSPGEQQLFQRLSVFQGYWNIAAAEAVCSTASDTTDLLEGIQSLVDKSMLQQREMHSGEQYFVLLETLREFALEHLAISGESAMWFARHATYYQQLVSGHEEWHNDESFTAWSAAVELAFDNIRRAFSWLLDHDPANAAQIVTALSEYWYFHKRASEGMSWVEYALPHAHNLPAYTQAKLYNIKALFLRERGDITGGRNYNLKAAQLLEAAGGYEQLRNASMAYYGISLAISDLVDEAETVLNNTLQQQRANNDTIGVARTLMHLSRCYDERRDPARAAAVLEESVALYKQIGTKRHLISVFSMLAAMYGQSQQLDRVQPIIEETLELCQRFGDVRNEVRAYINLAALYIIQKQYIEAGQLMLRAFPLAQRSPSVRAQILILLNLATVMYHLERVQLSVQIQACTDTFMRQMFPDEYTQTFAAQMQHNVDMFSAVLSADDYNEAWEQGLSLSIQAAFERTAREMEHLAQQANHSALPTPEMHQSATEQHNTTIGTTAYAGSSLAELTPREQDILRLVAAGFSNRDIGERLHISERTVHAHIRSVYSKLGINSRSAATRVAVQNGLG